MKNIFKTVVLIIFTFVLFSSTSCSKDDGTTTTGTETEQQLVFKEFWDVYDRYYPLMVEKRIDWQSVYDTYNPQITATTTDNELFGHFQSIMGTIIKDGHSSLTYNNTQETQFSPDFSENIQNMVQNNTPSKVNIVASSTSNPYISYGTLVSDSNIGYILSKQFEPVNDNESEFNNFKSIVDEALTALQSKTGIIIDIRTNGGGQGPFAYYLAGRFFSTSTPIELVRMRNKTTTGSTAASLSDWITTEFVGYPDSRAAEGGHVGGIFPEDFTINASGTFQYTNKVAVLTSRGTASAAEYFTAAMKTQTHIKTIGNITFGIFAGSDALTLTNGAGKWVTRLSVQDVQMNYNGTFQSFESIGITPDEISIPTTIQVSSGEDTHIEAAINYINN